MAVRLLLRRLWPWAWFLKDRERSWIFDQARNVTCIGIFGHLPVEAFSDGVVVDCPTKESQRRR